MCFNPQLSVKQGARSIEAVSQGHAAVSLKWFSFKKEKVRFTSHWSHLKQTNKKTAVGFSFDAML